MNTKPNGDKAALLTLAGVLSAWLCLTIFLPWRPAQADIFTFGFHGTLCPVVCNESTDARRGYIVDIMNEIAGPAGIEISILDMPKTRLMGELKTGKLDALLLPPVPIERNQLIKTTLPIVYYTIGVMRRHDFPFTFSGVDSLKPVRWGVVGGERWRGPYHRHIQENKDGNVTLIYGSQVYDRLTKMLARDRIDIVISHFDMLEYKRQRSRFASRLVVDRTQVFGERVPVYLAFAPDSRRASTYMQLFSDGVRKLSRRGRLKEIFAAYDVGEWAGVRPHEIGD